MSPVCSYCIRQEQDVHVTCAPQQKHLTGTGNPRRVTKLRSWQESTLYLLGYLFSSSISALSSTKRIIYTVLRSQQLPIGKSSISGPRAWPNRQIATTAISPVLSVILWDNCSGDGSIGFKWIPVYFWSRLVLESISWSREIASILSDGTKSTNSLVTRHKEKQGIFYFIRLKSKENISGISARKKIEKS
jgi:hypothetical protein